MKPLVTVLIPVVGRADQLLATLESLQAQTLGQWHALVLECRAGMSGGDARASVDDVWSAVGGVTREESRISLIRSVSLSEGAACNAALAHADGWCLHLMRPGDRLHPDALRALAERAVDAGAAAGLCTPADLVSEDALLEGRITLDDLLGGAHLPSGGVMVRRDALGDVRFNEHIEACVIDDLWLRLALRGVRFEGVSRPVVRHAEEGADLFAGSGLAERRATRLRELDVMLAEGFAAAAERQGPGRGAGMDLTEARRVRTMASMAMRIGTTHALARRDAPDEGAALCAPYLVKGAGLQATGIDAIARGAAVVLRREPSRIGELLPALERWCALCARRGWVDETGAAGALDERVREAIAPLLVERESVATELVERAARMGRAVTIVGRGAHAAMVARLAAGRSMRVLVRAQSREDQMDEVDQGDLAGAGRERLRGLPPGAVLEASDAPFARDGAVVVTALMDEGVLAREGMAQASARLGPRLLRWRVVWRARVEASREALGLGLGVRSGVG